MQIQFCQFTDDNKAHKQVGRRMTVQQRMNLTKPIYQLNAQQKTSIGNKDFLFKILNEITFTDVYDYSLPSTQLFNEAINIPQYLSISFLVLLLLLFEIPEFSEPEFQTDQH